MTYCAVPGCASDSDLSDSSTNFTFDPLSSSQFTNNKNVKILNPNAVPRPFKHSTSRGYVHGTTEPAFAEKKNFPKCYKNNKKKRGNDHVKSPNDGPTNLRESPDEAGLSDELIACRACLVADGRLYAISGSGLEDALATLTGIAMPEAECFPRHLCEFCVTKLSKYVAFRDSCRRSTALLESLLEKGPLKMNVIKAFNRNSQQLTNNLTCNQGSHIETDSFIEVVPIIKTENSESSHEEVECAKVKYIDIENILKKGASDVDERAFELPIENQERPRSEVVKSRTKNIKCIVCLLKDEFEIENPYAHLEIDGCVDSEAENNSDVDTYVYARVKKCRRPRVTLKKANTAKRPKQHRTVKRKVDGHPTKDTDTPEETTGPKKKAGTKSSTESGFENKNDSETKLLNKEEPKPKLRKRKKRAKPVYSCDLCGREFKILNTFRRHKASHDPNLTKEIFATMKKDRDLDFEKKYNFDIKILSKEEQKQRIEDRKNKASEYSCDVCGKYHSTESALKSHKAIYHDPSLPVECDVCWYRFRSPQELRQHQLADRHRVIFTCNECGHVNRNRMNAKDHCLKHRGNTHTCPYCQKKFPLLISCYNHIRFRHPGENEACDECGETFLGKVGLLVHKKMRHKTNDKPNEDLKCKDCDVEFSSAEALQRHCELGAGVPHAALWACAACGDSCGSETARANHAAERHPPEHYCEECNKTFLNLESFELHLHRKHMNRPPPWPGAGARGACAPPKACVCEICGKVLKNPALPYHMNAHLDVKPFQCRQCPKTFTHPNFLRLHKRVHTGERPYQCDQCPQAFALRGNLVRHLKNVHMRVQAKCDKCGKTMCAASLSAHVRAVHMGLPYVRRKREKTKKPARVAKS